MRFKNRKQQAAVMIKYSINRKSKGIAPVRVLDNIGSKGYTAHALVDKERLRAEGTTRAESIKNLEKKARALEDVESARTIKSRYDIKKVGDVYMLYDRGIGEFLIGLSYKTEEAAERARQVYEE